MIKKHIKIFLIIFCIIILIFSSSCASRKFSYNKLMDGLIKIEFYSETRIFYRDGSCYDSVEILHVLSKEEMEECVKAISSSTLSYGYDETMREAHPGFVFYYEDETKNTTYNQVRVYEHRGIFSQGYWEGPINDLLNEYINKYIK